MEKLPIELTQTKDTRLGLIRFVSKLMDEQFSIGKFKFGLDPIINLIPVAGDVAGFIVSSMLVVTMARYGASGKVAIKMLGNILLDAVVGIIPFLGWIFDFSYKANTRNLKLLSNHYEFGKDEGSGKGIIIFIVVFMLLILISIVWSAIWVTRYVYQHIF